MSAVERVYREHRAHMLAALIRVFGDFELAEDVLQDACATALRRWAAGVPDDPVAWLLTVARNRAIDWLRRERVGRAVEAAQAVQVVREEAAMSTDFPEFSVERLLGLGDERLSLIFTCCHPALALEARVALTLQAVAGLTAGEIARVFLVGEAKLVATLMPDEPEALGLVALLLLHESRSAARQGASGELVLLADQERSRWDRGRIVEAVGVLDRALRHGVVGPYQLQAMIAAQHVQSPTDWATDRRAVRDAAGCRAVAGGGPQPRGGGRGVRGGGGGVAAGRGGRGAGPLPPLARDSR